MPKCTHCGEEFTAEDLEEAGISLAGAKVDIEELELCPACAEGISDFEGDFNLFHPEETAEEFASHED